MLRFLRHIVVVLFSNAASLIVNIIPPMTRLSDAIDFGDDCLNVFGRPNLKIEQ